MSTVVLGPSRRRGAQQEAGWLSQRGVLAGGPPLGEHSWRPPRWKKRGPRTLPASKSFFYVELLSRV